MTSLIERRLVSLVNLCATRLTSCVDVMRTLKTATLRNHLNGTQNDFYKS